MRKALVPMAMLSSMVQSGVAHTRRHPPTAAAIPAVNAPLHCDGIRHCRLQDDERTG